MLDPVVRTIEVPCSQAEAFSVFVEQMGIWWPLAKRSVSAMGGNVPKSLRVEAKAGGQIIETAHNGEEHLWGTVRAYDPSDFFSMDFHMGIPAPESASLVEVRFTVLDEQSTRVELSQSNWEAFGEQAEMMRGGYGSSWGMIFEEAYKSACGG